MIEKCTMRELSPIVYQFCTKIIQMIIKIHFISVRTYVDMFFNEGTYKGI
jgi:hypothetical protein